MREYLQVVERVLREGSRKPNRTGVDTLSCFNVNYEIDLSHGFPLLTTKKVNWKNIVAETLWFLSGDTDISFLHKHGCHFWDPWADAQGRVPSAYGHFWRHFPVHDAAGNPAHTDQIAWVVEQLQRNPDSRRLVVSAWAPGNAQASALPPCHAMFIVNVQYAGGEPLLCLHLTQRSADVALGVPYNIATYALLLTLLGRFTGIRPGRFAHTLVDAHIYTSTPDGRLLDYDHVPGLREQLARTPRPLPTLHLSNSIQQLGDIERLLQLDTAEMLAHFQLEGYDPHPPIAFKVAV